MLCDTLHFMMFLLFAGETYHARGGWADFHGRYESLDEALKRAHEMQIIADRDSFTSGAKPDDHCHIDWWHIVDLDTGHAVLCGNAGYDREDPKRLFWQETTEPWWTE